MVHMQHYFARELPAGLESLGDLALDLRWSWSHASDTLWKRIDQELWEATGNPWLILENTSRDHLEALARDNDFLDKLRGQVRARDESLNAPTWFSEQDDTRELDLVAYFSMEFGLSEALPIYSGGLGILAGDMLKTASDLGVPMVGVGLLYQQGYFRQMINVKGQQQAYFPYNNPAMLPVLPVRKSDGSWLHVNVEFPGRMLRLRCWEARVGRVRLLLLDANGMSNHPRDRGITGELYGGDEETRLQQEIVLGIGGWRMLDALGLTPTVSHLNEGHAAFAVLQRAAQCARQHDLDFITALQATRAGNLFTTHTPVVAAFDQFPSALIRKYFNSFAKQWMVDIEALLDLGRTHLGDERELFNMAFLALRASGAINGVSRLHGIVSRELFAPLFPRWPLAEIPVGHVTNGVHTPSWDSAEADDLWTKACGENRWISSLDGIEVAITTLDDTTLWDFRTRQRQRLISTVRVHAAHQRAGRAESERRIEECSLLFDPNALTLGFARRFTGYKRPNLLLVQPERLARLLCNQRHPVQLVLSGKAHPRDLDGQDMIRQWIEFIARADIQGRVVFIEDYDMAVASDLVQGVDAWINTPRRPWEASGTSGMKILVNGGLNISELDGWWAEAYSPEVGWALGDGNEHGIDPAWDFEEADALYQLLETSIVPEFYERNDDGIPSRWVSRVRASMARLTPAYSTNRMLREYVENYYLPRAEAFSRRIANNGRGACDLRKWSARVAAHWSAVRIGDLECQKQDNGMIANAQIFLDGLPPDDIAVELYADGIGANGASECYWMERVQTLAGAVNGFRYRVSLTTTRPSNDYTVRVRPAHPLAEVPLEEPHILWSR
ncbi:alpha-glucan phosphorylase [Acidihalobacter yilgarnensis]|uniref:Alpha-glucan phosphorylase n=1 Tax=Acidihalobacter yilgarnensis TaxID=2819280 RepID=A0A1D8IP62_9GAMM|nr:alpha-glucan family phosphorylase [Acidihalobacter yilgarnensis]AOU98300.1 alpha-glucan phosphorylase [Acidihalobacter yilgarnensis]